MAHAAGCGGLLRQPSAAPGLMSFNSSAARIPRPCLRHSARCFSRAIYTPASKLDVPAGEESSASAPVAVPARHAATDSRASNGSSGAATNGANGTGANGANGPQSVQPAVPASIPAALQPGQSSSSTGSSSSSSSSPAVQATETYPEWYAAVGLSAVAALICSVDRAAISVAILPMSEQYGWSDTTKGAINSAFYIGYTLTNLVGGYLASTWSAKQVLGAGVVLWSIFTITTPIAAAGSLPLLLGNRALMGAGEGVTFPCVQNIVKFWCPGDVRSRALALIYSGGQLGTIVALVTAPLIIQNWGWPAVFEVYGSLGLLWIVAWQRLVSETPPVPLQPAAAAISIAQPAAGLEQQSQQQQQLPQQQQQQLSSVASLLAPGSIQQQQQQASQLKSLSALPRIKDIPWKSFFTNKAFIALLLTHSSFGVGHYVCLSWLPTYYNQEFGVDVQQSALLSVLPWFVTILVSNSSGWIADGLANSGRLSMTNTRKLLQTIGSVGPACALLYLATAHNNPGELEMGEAVGALTATLALGGFQSAGFAANHQDISSRYAAVLFGITNALSSLMGTFSVYATGLILDASHSWSLVFELVAAFYLVGAAAFVTMASAEQQFE